LFDLEVPSPLAANTKVLYINRLNLKPSNHILTFSLCELMAKISAAIPPSRIAFKAVYLLIFP
jgi:hypothetical protein